MQSLYAAENKKLMEQYEPDNSCLTNGPPPVNFTQLCHKQRAKLKEYKNHNGCLVESSCRLKSITGYQKMEKARNLKSHEPV